jgi:hypothetical protein
MIIGCVLAMLLIFTLRGFLLALVLPATAAKTIHTCFLPILVWLAVSEALVS